MSERVFKIGRSTSLYSAPMYTHATNLAGRLGRSGFTGHVFSDSVTGGNEWSDHHADPCLTARGVTAVGVKVFTSDLHGIQEDSRAQLHVEIRR